MVDLGLQLVVMILHEIQRALCLGFLLFHTSVLKQLYVLVLKHFLLFSLQSLNLLVEVKNLSSLLLNLCLNFTHMGLEVAY